jgi:hypothetical protein
MYKEESSKHLIEMNYMGCEYILEYQGLIEQFLSIYVVLLALFLINETKKTLNYIFSLVMVYKTHSKQSMECNQQKIC